MFVGVRFFLLLSENPPGGVCKDLNKFDKASMRSYLEGNPGEGWLGEEGAGGMDPIKTRAGIRIPQSVCPL